MKRVIQVSLMLAFVLISCKKENNGGGTNDNNNGGGGSSSFKGKWHLVDLLDSPDYISGIGDMMIDNGKVHCLAQNKFARFRYIITDANRDTTHISTPFDNEQSIGHTVICKAGTDATYIGYNIFLGSTKIHHHLRTGTSWQTLPDISINNYSFNNREFRAAYYDGKIYLAVCSADSIYIVKYEAGTWKAEGSKAFSPIRYNFEMKAGANSLSFMSFDGPSGNNPGLTFKTLRNGEWKDEQFTNFTSSTEMTYPQIDVNANDDLLFGYLTYSGSFIYSKTNGSNTWQERVNRSLTDKFYFSPRFDKDNRGRINACIISHFAQVSQALWGLARIDGNTATEYIVDYDKDVPGYRVIFNPITFNTMKFGCESGHFYFYFRENRSPFVGSFVQFKMD